MKNLPVQIFAIACWALFILPLTVADYNPEQYALSAAVFSSFWAIVSIYAAALFLRASYLILGIVMLISAAISFYPLFFLLTK